MQPSKNQADFSPLLSFDFSGYKKQSKKQRGLPLTLDIINENPNQKIQLSLNSATDFYIHNIN